MPQRFPCPFLGTDVELTDEREAHIRQKHSDVLGEGFDLIAQTLAAPDLIRGDAAAPNTLKFSRWYHVDSRGRNAVVIVVSDQGPPRRDWIVTAFVARRVPEGNVIWRRT